MPRQRWVQINGELLEVSEDYTPAENTAPRHFIIGDANYHGLRSPIDGADISTKTKHYEYMKQKGLALTDDFKGEFEKAAKDRASGRDPTRIEDVRRDFETHQRRS